MDDETCIGCQYSYIAIEGEYGKWQREEPLQCVIRKKAERCLLYTRYRIGKKPILQGFNA